MSSIELRHRDPGWFMQTSIVRIAIPLGSWFFEVLFREINTNWERAGFASQWRD